MGRTETVVSTEPWGNSPHERPDGKKRSILPKHLSNPLLKASLTGCPQYKEAGESALKARKRGKKG